MARNGTKNVGTGCAIRCEILIMNILYMRRIVALVIQCTTQQESPIHTLETTRVIRAVTRVNMIMQSGEERMMRIDICGHGQSQRLIASPCQ